MAFRDGRESANEEKLHRACSGGEMKGRKCVVPLKLHASSCSRKESHKELITFPQGSASPIYM